MDFWIMVGIMVFAFVGQAALWSWVLIERQKKIPDVKILNWDELVQWARGVADGYYRAMGRR